jgi:hypothetical protein
MNVYFELGLIGVLLSGPKSTVTAENNPALSKALHLLGVNYAGVGQEDDVKERLFHLCAVLENKLAYYDSSELEVNWPLNQYLGELLTNAKADRFESSKNISMVICGMGNKKGEAEANEAIGEWLDYLHEQIRHLMDIYEGHEEASLERFTRLAQQLQYGDKVLELLDVFVTSRLGMLAGLEEFPQSALLDLPESPEPDFEMAEQCSQASDCSCGCTLDHSITLLQGMEDILNSRDTYESHYVIGVASANNVRMPLVAGNEGPVLDALKDLGQKAWEAITESFKAIKELVTSEGDKEKTDSAEEKATANKKSLQAIGDNSARINDAAKAGIMALCDKTDATGAMKAIASTLNTAGDGPRVIDAFMGLLAKEVTSGNGLNDRYKAAEKALADLKTVTNKAASVDENNKDVVSSAKTQVNEKVTAAKEALKEVKKEVTAHNKRIAGIVKAITGINEKIFSKKSYPAGEKPKESK